MNQQSTSHQTKVRLKTIALPNEHGAWAFWLEPVLLGLALAASLAGFLLALAALAALLLQHPLSLVLSDRRRRVHYSRTSLAQMFLLLYGSLALTCLLLALWLSSNMLLLLPLLLAAPLGLLQLWYDSRNQGRALTAELSGATAMGATASCMLIAAGWSLLPALLIWLLLAARTVPTIIYIRNRLRLERGSSQDSHISLIAHVSAVILVVALALVNLIPYLATLPFMLLQARASLGLSRFRKPRPAKVIGFQELFWGVITVLLLALAYRFW